MGGVEHSLVANDSHIICYGVRSTPSAAVHYTRHDKLTVGDRPHPAAREVYVLDGSCRIVATPKNNDCLALTKHDQLTDPAEQRWSTRLKSSTLGSGERRISLGKGISLPAAETARGMHLPSPVLESSINFGTRPASDPQSGRPSNYQSKANHTKT